VFPLFVSKNYTNHICYRWFYLLYFIPFPASPFSSFLPCLQRSTISNKKIYRKNEYKILSLRVADVVFFTEERDRDHQPPPPTNLCGERKKRMKKMRRHSSSSSSSSLSSSSSARTSASALALTSSTKREFCFVIPTNFALVTRVFLC